MKSRFYLGDKRTIKEVIEKVFNVKVVSVTTAILPGKKRRLGKFQGFKMTYKRVFVTLVCLFLFVKNFAWVIYVLISIFVCLLKKVLLRIDFLTPGSVIPFFSGL